MLSLADRQELDKKDSRQWWGWVGGWRMCSWKVEGEAMAYPWVTIVFPRPPLTPNPPYKLHLLSILCARHYKHFVSSFFTATLWEFVPQHTPFFFFFFAAESRGLEGEATCLGHMEGELGLRPNRSVNSGTWAHTELAPALHLKLAAPGSSVQFSKHFRDTLSL